MPSSRYASRSAVTAAIVGLAILAGTIACGSGQPAQGNPLAGLTAAQIAAKAVADLKAASSVRYAGTITESGQTDDVDVTAGTTDCVGTFGVPGKGSFALLKVGQTLWIKPDTKFWASEGTNTAVLQLVEGKYIQIGSNDSALNSVRMLCSPVGIADSFGNQMNHLVTGGTMTIAGQGAVELRDTQTSDRAWVTISASPQFVRLDHGGQGQLDFSDYDAPVTASPPPASETIPGSQIGL